MIIKVAKNEIRQRKHERVRKKIFGTPERPRLNVFRSLKHIYAQIIDDTTGTTLVAASTVEKEIKDKMPYGGNKQAARESRQADRPKGTGERHKEGRIRQRRLSVPRKSQRTCGRRKRGGLEF